MTIADLPHWINTHPAEALTFAIVALGAVVGAMPEAWQRKPFVGFLVRLMECASPLAHRDSPGTLKLPGTTAVVPHPPHDDLAALRREVARLRDAIAAVEARRVQP